MVVVLSTSNALAQVSGAAAEANAAPPAPMPEKKDEPGADHPKMSDHEARLKGLEAAASEKNRAAGSDANQKLRFSGDVGYRFEYMRNVAHLDTEHSYRNRYRLRIEGKYQPNPEWELGFRITNADPRYPSTGWESFGQSPSPGEVAGPEAGSGRSGFVNFDRAYLNWKPASWFQLRLGKQEIPIWKPWAVWRSSVWHDDDVQPAGTAEIVSFPSFGAMKSLRLVAGQYYLDQIITTDPARGATLFVNQVNGVLGFGESVDVSWGVGFHVFHNLDGFAAGRPQAMTAGVYRNRSTNVALRSPSNAASRGGPPDGTNDLNCSAFSSGSNSLPACERYNSKFRLGNAGIELLLKSKLPIRLTFDAAYNFGATAYRPGGKAPALAWLTHVSAGDFKEPGQVQLGAGFYYGQADATWAVYADDDYLNTNVQTVMVNAKWRVIKDVLVVWDTYVRRWVSPELAVMQGIVPDTASGNAAFVSSRFTAVASF